MLHRQGRNKGAAAHARIDQLLFLKQLIRIDNRNRIHSEMLRRFADGWQLAVGKQNTIRNHPLNALCQLLIKRNGT